MRQSGVLFAAWLLGATVAAAGGVAIVATSVTDDGDHDGFADTRETVSVQLSVQNTSGQPLTGVTATFSNLVPLTGCLTAPTVVIGSLAAGETKSVGPVVFVTEKDRPGLGLGPYDELSATFAIEIDSDQGPILAFPPELTFDLDLDVSGGSGATSFFESFEPGTLGTFEIDNMDQGLTSLAAADGWRCPTHDPDGQNSNTNGFSDVEATCYPGITTAHAEAVFWGLSGPTFSPLGGRGFSGFHSLYFGIDLGPPKNWTTPLSVLEAARTTEPIALDWAGAAPTLSVKHQSSLVDDYRGGYDGGFDRGVVMVQVTDDTGDPVGNWFKVHPYRNPYVDANATNAANCMFDPIDDGNNEDDFFDPTDPNRRLGPSSTCEPGLVFMEMGETSNPFDAGNVGSADGPGLEGGWGIGTWIESKIDLSRFRGRQVRLRFLVSAVRAADYETWDAFGHFENPHPEEDGWWIDDVTIDHALSTPASIAVDAHDNSGLPGAPGPDGDADGIHDVCDNCPAVASPNGRDADGDGAGDACDSCPYDPLSSDGTDFDGDKLCVNDNCRFNWNPNQANSDGDPAGNACDCSPTDATTYPGAPEINDGKDNNCPGDADYGIKDEISGNAGFYNAADKNEFSWTPQQGATLYQVARASQSDFTSGCASVTTTNAFHVDTVPLAPGGIRYYLVRPKAPNVGSWGKRSSGQLRALPLGCAS